MKKVYFRYVSTANVTGTTPGHYYECEHRYATGTYVLASEAEAEIEDTRNRSCCKYPDYCDGECTCKICAPDIHIEQLESKLAAAAERERVLRKALKEALFSMENFCAYAEDHKNALSIVRAALSTKGE